MTRLLMTLEINVPADRKAYLNKACADLDLRSRVERLLRAYDDAGTFMQKPAPKSAGRVDQPLTERAGMVIGPYKLLEEIGEGGFGIVFMAHQQHPLRRKVALKVIKPGMDSKQVIARFEAERRTSTAMVSRITALDPNGNLDTNYQGTVTFSTSDADPGVLLPAAYTFTMGVGGDNGVNTFSGGATLVTVGTQTLSVADTVSGMSGNITITVGPGP
jgi:hypothetical protein